MTNPVYTMWIDELNKLCQARYDLDASSCVSEFLTSWYDNSVTVDEAFVRIMMRMGCVNPLRIIKDSR